MFTTVLLNLFLLLHSSPAPFVIDLPSVIAERVDRETMNDSLAASEPLVLPYLSDIRAAARENSVPMTLLAGVIQEESRFDPWASRFEEQYMNSGRVRREAIQWSRAHRDVPTALTERADRSRSYGLLQIMGETARTEGYDKRYLTELFLTSDGLRTGAHHLRLLLLRYPHDTLSAISAYNQGSAKKRGGTFANARYVYRVTVAWRMYEAIVRGEERRLR